MNYNVCDYLQVFYILLYLGSLTYGKRSRDQIETLGLIRRFRTFTCVLLINHIDFDQERVYNELTKTYKGVVSKIFLRKLRLFYYS